MQEKFLSKPSETKGQSISKRLFGVFNSSKKWTKNFCPSSLGQKFECQVCFYCQVRFLEELKTPKRHFEINWPLICITILFRSENVTTVLPRKYILWFLIIACFLAFFWRLSLFLLLITFCLYFSSYTLFSNYLVIHLLFALCSEIPENKLAQDLMPL